MTSVGGPQMRSWGMLAATAVLGVAVGGIGIVDATTPSAAVTLVPITPCRVADTRVATNVGDRSTPLGGGETMAVSMRSSAGNPRGGGSCDGVVPVEATAVSLNVTALRASAATFLTVWPAGVAMPNASSLNPVPGAPPTPNAVVTGLSADDRFNVFNLRGAVDLVIDVNGYYVDHHHDDRYPTRTELAARDPLQIVIGPQDFVAARSGDELRYFAGVEMVALNSLPFCGEVVASVDLPHRAIVTRLRARLRNSSGLGFTVRLEAYPLSSTGQLVLAAIFDDATSGQFRTLVDTSIDDPRTVDATAHRYYVNACIPEGQVLADVVINYTLP